MESFDSSPNYMRATSSFDAKKENSPQGGSECDEIMSVSSSTCGSAINNNGNKYRTNNKKTMKNFGNLRSFRRRTKSRITTMSENTATSHCDSLVDSSEASPHYLKATSSSEGKKMHLRASPWHLESSIDSCDKNGSLSSHPKLVSSSNRSLQTLSRTSSLRSVRILMKKSSFKPKRLSLNYPKVSDGVSIDRATYSSTLKDSKFPKQMESEKISAMKVCRYHHCSLHGHCHGNSDPVPSPKRFLYKRRRSLKKQRSLLPRTESRPRAKNSSNRKKPLNEKSVSDGKIFSGVESKNDLDAYDEIYDKREARPFGDGYNEIQELDLIEVAFGETSFPERSYRENLDISRKYGSLEQGFGGTSFGSNGYCLRCSCHNREQDMATPGGTDADLSVRKVASSEIPQSGAASSAIFKKSEEHVSTYVEDNMTSSSAAFDKDCPETPIIFDGNSDKEGEFKTDSTPTGDSEVNMNSETNSPANEGGKLQFSKQRHISMWHLIHQHMSSNLAAEPANKPLQDADGGSPAGGADPPLAKESLTSGKDLSDPDTGMVNNDSESQEIEIRKLFAIKLVREAIEKILLPEVQDQISDDQSVTSENTPRAEIVETNQSKEENYEDSDANKGEDNVSLIQKEESLVKDVASGLKIMETEEKVVRKSEKKAPKHWSNLKKWILLQRFIRELEKVRKFNPRKPQHLSINPDPEAEKVNLRPQTVDERKNAEEWMLDYALRQAVNQLAPTQKRKVALLVKAFETVVPPQEESQVQFRISRLKDNSLDIGNKVDESISDGNQETGTKSTEKTDDLPENARKTARDHLDLRGIRKDTNVSLKSEYLDGDFMSSNGKGERSSAKSLILDGDGKSVAADSTLGPASHHDAMKLEKITADEIVREAMPTPEDGISDCVGGKTKDGGQCIETNMKKHIKMWHMIYQHVVSGIAEKVGSQLLDGSEDDEVEDDKSPVIKHDDCFDDFSNPTNHSSQKDDISSNVSIAFTKSDAVKLIKEAVDEILVPEIQDDSSDTQSVTSESISDQDISERNFVEIGGRNISTESGVLMDEEEKSSTHDIISTQENKKPEQQKSKNWSKLKKLILLKRSIRALEKARKLKPQPRPMLRQTLDPEREKIDLRSQMMDERKKAEQWMLDYAVQHIVTKLTPARKRRVSMLVEAFEAVVPLPEI